jgi:hypothetical protein
MHGARAAVPAASSIALAATLHASAIANDIPLGDDIRKHYRRHGDRRHAEWALLKAETGIDYPSTCRGFPGHANCIYPGRTHFQEGV